MTDIRKCNNRLLHLAGAALALIWIIPLLGTAVLADLADRNAEPVKKGKVCFKPGAEVTFEFFFVAPPGFHLGEDPLAAVSFDKKKVAKLPVTIKPLEYSWTRKELVAEEAKSGHDQTTVAARIKMKLGSDCTLGELAIPVSVDVYYCSTDEGWCTYCHYDAVLKLNVSDDEEALGEGALKVAVVVTPEV